MEGKIITCCGDCVHYDWKKHKCRNGHNEIDTRKHFYTDCKTLEDLEEHDAKGRADAIHDMYISIMMSIEEVKHGENIDKAFDWLHQFDEQLKEQKNGEK